MFSYSFGQEKLIICSFKTFHYIDHVIFELLVRILGKGKSKSIADSKSH